MALSVRGRRAELAGLAPARTSDGYRPIVGDRESRAFGLRSTSGRGL